MTEQLSDGRKKNEYGEFEFDDEFEESLIALVIRNKDFSAKYGRYVKEEHFSSQLARDIFIIISEYRDKYGTEIDKSILKNEVREKYTQYRHREETVDDYLASVDRMFDLDVVGMAEYAADKVLNFARRRQLKINLKLIASKVTGEALGLEECRGKIDEALDIGRDVATQREVKLNIELPKDIIRGFARDFADVYEKHYESPHIFLTFAVLAHLGAILCKEVSLKLSFDIEPRLYLVLVGESAATKKSTAFVAASKFFTDYFEQFEPEILGDAHCEILETSLRHIDADVSLPFREGIELYSPEVDTDYELEEGEVRPRRRIYYQRVGRDKNPLPSVFYHRCDGVGSAEGLMIDLQKAPKLMLFYDEMLSFVNKCEARESSLLSKVNELFQKTSIENRTKTGKVQYVRDAHLSFFGCCTTDTFQRMFSHAFADIGFMNRLWLVMADSDRAFSKPPVVTPWEKAKLMEKFNKIMKTFPYKTKTIIGFEPDAEKRWDDWYVHLDRDENTKRLDSNLGFKMMQLMAINECKYKIDLEMMERVIKLLEYQRQVRVLSKPIEATSEVAMLENLIRKALLKHGELTARELKQFTNATRYKTQDFEKALESMVKIEEIGKRRKGKTDLFRLLDNLQIIKKWKE